MASPPEWLIDWTSLLNAVGVLLLTLFLVRYYRQQKEISRRNHTGLLSVEDFELDGNRVVVYLSNYGNGPIRRLRLGTLLFSEEGLHRHYSLNLNHLERLASEPDEGVVSAGANVIEPGERAVPFRGGAKVGVEPPDDFRYSRVPISFSAALQQMQDAGASIVKYQLAVVGEDILDKTERTRVFPLVRSTDLSDTPPPPSLQGLRMFTEHGGDHTFDEYFEAARLWDVYLFRIRYYLTKRWAGIRGKPMTWPPLMNASGLGPVEDDASHDTSIQEYD